MKSSFDVISQGLPNCVKFERVSPNHIYYFLLILPCDSFYLHNWIWHYWLKLCYRHGVCFCLQLSSLRFERALPGVWEWAKWNLFASMSMAAAASRTLSVLVLLAYFQLAICQYSGGRPVQPAGYETFTLPPPGDPNYRTYVFNSRRYGQVLPARPYIPSYNDPSLPNPNSYDPNINRGLPPGEDPNRYMFNDVSIIVTYIIVVYYLSIILFIHYYLTYLNLGTKTITLNI